MKTTLNHLHHQHTDWLRELDFYKLELKLLTERLAEVASANTAMSVAQQVEHYQNRFILLNEQLDVLRHDVKLKEQALQEEIKTKPSHIDEKISHPGESLLERVNYLFKSIADTRFEFNGFLAKTL
jgi:hypothetical protein